jgi:hypothetical protein
MNAEVFDDIVHHWVDSATRRGEQRCGTPAALLLVAGMSPSRLAIAPHHSSPERFRLPFLG